VTERDDRELSVKDWLTRGRDVRHELAGIVGDALAQPSRYPFVVSPTGQKAGTLTGSSLLTVRPIASDAMAGWVEAYCSESSLGDLIAASVLQALEGHSAVERWLDSSPPLVIRSGRSGRVRFACFNWTTGRDGFIEALLGNPVPKQPRYSEVGPVERLRVEGDLWDVQESLGFAPGDAAELYGLGADEASVQAEALGPVLQRLAAWEPAAALLAQTLAGRDQPGFAASSFGRLLLPLARGAPGWRSPSLVSEWCATYDLGIAGVLGVAIWPSGYEMRKHRRLMAAHLRWLFDHHVAPWNRWHDERRRREGFLLFWRDRMASLLDGGRPTIRRVAEAARRVRPDLYRPEPMAVTVRRLERMNRALGLQVYRRRRRMRPSPPQPGLGG
jgi:hypothetical protein